jgi:hypothetical protein
MSVARFSVFLMLCMTVLQSWGIVAAENHNHNSTQIIGSSYHESSHVNLEKPSLSLEEHDKKTADNNCHQATIPASKTNTSTSQISNQNDIYLESGIALEGESAQQGGNAQEGASESDCCTDNCQCIDSICMPILAIAMIDWSFWSIAPASQRFAEFNISLPISTNTLYRPPIS